MGDSLSADELGRVVEGLRVLVLDAGARIMRLYEAGTADVRYKDDASPVTSADEAASACILAGLPDVLPGVAVVCEETEPNGGGTSVGRRFVLVDPLDGTKEFIGRNGEFTVNVALIERGRPVAGVVYAPAIGRVFLGWRAGEESAVGHAFEERAGGTRRAIRVTKPHADGLVVVASRSHRDAETDAYLARTRVKSFVSAGSSLKLCMVAGGEADLYPRLGRTMEWDTAAGQAVLEAAGGSVARLQGRDVGARLEYGKPGFENPPFVARGAE